MSENSPSVNFSKFVLSSFISTSISEAATVLDFLNNLPSSNSTSEIEVDFAIGSIDKSNSPVFNQLALVSIGPNSGITEFSYSVSIAEFLKSYALFFL